MTGSSGTKVVLLTARSDTGGGPKHVLELTRYLNEHGLQPIICSPMQNPYGPEYLKNSLFHVQCPHRSFSLGTLFALINLGKENSSIIFHSHGRGAGFYTKILSLFGFSCFHTFHGAHAPKNTKEKCILLIEKLLGKNIKKYFCVSPDERENVLSLNLSSASKTVVVCNNYPITNPLKSSPSTPFKHFGVLSRLDPHKNNIKILQFFSKLLKGKPELKLSIAGDGEEMEKLKTLSKKLGIEPHVTFLGNISDIDTFFESIDCLLSTSKGEGLPYTVLEAYERGVPCLLSQVQGHRFVQEEEFLFSLDSYDSFLDCLQLLENKSLESVTNRYEFLKTTFSEEKTFGKLMNFYSERE